MFWNNLGWMALGVVITVIVMSLPWRRALFGDQEHEPETLQRASDRIRDREAREEERRLEQDEAAINTVMDAILEARRTVRLAEQDWEARQSAAMSALALPREPYRIVPHPSGSYQVQKFSIDKPVRPDLHDESGYGYGYPRSKLGQKERDLSSLEWRINAIRGHTALPTVQWTRFGGVEAFPTFAAAKAWVEAWCTHQDEIRVSRQGALNAPPPLVSLEELGALHPDAGC